MMNNNKFSIDIFSETNPAFCSIILGSFIKGYIESAKCNLNIGLLTIVLPIILNREYRQSFNGTNKKTGIYKWILTNKHISYELSSLIEDSSLFLRQALMFGVYKKIIEFDESGYVFAVLKNLKKNKTKSLEEYLTYAERLGYWCGEVNSPITIINILGLNDEKMEY